MNPYQKFIILTTARTGSSHLVYLLDSHPNIVSMGEIYNEVKIWNLPEKSLLRKIPHLKKLRDWQPEAFLKFLIFHKYPSQIKAVGFKLLYIQTQDSPGKKLLRYISAQNEIKIIHLKRMNMLEMFISNLMAIKTGIWTSNDGRYPKIRFSIKPAECQVFFMYVEAQQKLFSRLFRYHQILDVSYENLVDKPQYEFNSIQTFLGVKTHQLMPKIQKLNHRAMRDIVSNYEPLKQQFRKTKWSKFFYE